jgi:hypothetical protein
MERDGPYTNGGGRLRRSYKSTAHRPLDSLFTKDFSRKFDSRCYFLCGNLVESGVYCSPFAFFKMLGTIVLPKVAFILRNATRFD